ncbi:MAG: hypothetical protein QXL94_05875 [Candidatus Parvarchaeum sp.]
MNSLYDNKYSIKNMLMIGIPTLLFLPIVLTIALLSGSLLFLDYVHVFSGASWTGMDLFMGLFFSFVMKGLDNSERVEVSKRLTPMMLFFMPSISAVTITAGIFLAIKEGIFILSSPIIIAVLVIAAILTIQGLLIFLPNELRVYFEIRRGSKDKEKIIRLTMFNLKLAFSQVIFQIAIILLMAHLATGLPL